LNTYRSLCDARGQASIVLHKGSTGVDELVCDLSPLRNPKGFDEVARKCLELREGGEIVFQGSGSTTGDEDSSSEGADSEDLSMTLGIVDDRTSSENESDAATSSSDDESENENENENNDGPWETRPIYQLPPYCVSWELPRGEAKALGKSLAKVFATIEGKKESKKPIGVKPGKGRRHGGYGIG